MKIVNYVFEAMILVLGFLLIVLPEIIYFSLWDLKDWIGDIFNEKNIFK